MDSEAGFNKVVKFRLGNEYFAISVEEVKEVVKMQKITRTPDSPPHVDGIIDLRGIVCTIIDPKKMLGTGETDSKGKERIIILDVGKNVGIKVDEVLSVDDFSEDNLEADVELGEFAKGIIKDDMDSKVEFVTWLNARMLVGEEKLAQLS